MRVSLGFFALACMNFFDANFYPAAICSFFFILALSLTFLTYKKWKNPPETIYTISIDDTASYNEIKNNFYSVKELPNGLYEVTLKQKK